MSGDVTAGYAVRLTVPVDTRTTPTGATGPDELRHTGLKGRSAGLAGDDAARSLQRQRPDAAGGLPDATPRRVREAPGWPIDAHCEALRTL